MNALKVLTVLAAAAMVFAACGTSDDEPDDSADSVAPTATEGSTDQPAVASDPEASDSGGDDVVADGHAQDLPLPVLTVSFGDGASAEAAPGTRCWGALCMDMVGPVTPIEPVNVEPGAAVSFDIDHTSEIGSGSVAWVPATEQWPESEFDGTVAWQAFPETVSDSLEGIAAPTEPGDYVMIISTFFEEGDVSFGLLVHVE